VFCIAGSGIDNSWIDAEPPVFVAWEDRTLTLNSTERFDVAHVKLPSVLPTETFVVNRLLNPYSRRPVPVLTMKKVYIPEWGNILDFHPLEETSRLFRRLDAGLQNRLHWSLYFCLVLKKLRPKMIHAHFSGAGEVCSWSARKLSIPLIVNFYGIEVNYHIHDPYWLPRYQRLYGAADAFICSSDYMRNAMIASGCSGAKIYVVRCGIDLDFFSGDPLAWEPNGVLRLLSIARLHKEKGLNYLLDACRMLNESGYKNWTLQIAGWGEEEANLRRQIRVNNLERQVFLAGTFRPLSVVQALRKAHIMILPSLKESQGVALQEAQATCTPVITTSVGGIPEGVVQGKTGIVVEPRNPRALFEAMLTFIKDPSLMLSMGMMGRQYVSSKFSRSTEYNELANVYQKFS
jgi:colanic acid/amylovoran biosynthesis glycosyltransferase